ncbi:MAG: M15 family metallopeptidase [Bacilli bacterium]|nr:M15 family metallopeptidase [Bacilli bacterium]MBR3209802.1 M15 family metallopeptidase [Bacilli bacterium]
MNKLILVNKNNPLERKINEEIVKVPAEISTIPLTKPFYELEKETLEAFIKLRQDALKTNTILLVDDGYRTFENQREIYETIASSKGKEYADKIVAKVGESEHHTGLAIDLAVVKDGKILDDDESGEILEHIHPILYKYGFILRYPKEKEKITGYPYEPWHIRYIGKEEATIMHNKNIKTLEEYIDIKKHKNL